MPSTSMAAATIKSDTATADSSWPTLNSTPGNQRAQGAFQAGPGYSFALDQGIDAIGPTDARAANQPGTLPLTGVVETPNGAHFTTCTPTYERDEKFQKAYATAAKTPEDWAAFEQQFLSGSEQDYQDAVAAFHETGTAGETA